jgi:cell division protein FtsB
MGSSRPISKAHVALNSMTLRSKRDILARRAPSPSSVQIVRPGVEAVFVKRRRSKPAETSAVTLRKGRRRVIESVLIVIGFVVLADALLGERGLVAMRRANQDYLAAENRLNAARRKYFELTEKIRRLREDPAAIEDAARRDLGLIKPGEKLFTIKELQPGSNSH